MIRAGTCAAWLALLAGLWPAALTGQAERRPLVVKLSLHDTVQPVTAEYVKRGIEDAAARHADLLLISLGTPGGLLESTRIMVEAIEASPIPVAIFVSPTGSRAGSAGFFLLEAADVAAMAPGTNAGAAHPVGGGSRASDPVMSAKIENDTAAFLRSYVDRRERNVEAAEDAVRSSKSYSDTEALHLKLIDLSARDDGDLLAQMDGRAIKRFDGRVEVLHTRGARILPVLPNLRERLLSRLVNPDLAVILLVLGALLVFLEFNVPGTVVPGSIGTLLIVLALFGLNLLPVRHAAVLFLLVGLGMLVLEAKFSSHGALGLAGVACLVFGLATLVDGPTPELRVHLPLAFAVGIAFGGIAPALAWMALRARRNKSLTGPQAMLGCSAVARTTLAPAGQVEIRGELWQARLAGSGSLPAGASVRLIELSGLTFLVEPLRPAPELSGTAPGE